MVIYSISGDHFQNIPCSKYFEVRVKANQSEFFKTIHQLLMQSVVNNLNATCKSFVSVPKSIYLWALANSHKFYQRSFILPASWTTSVSIHLDPRQIGSAQSNTPAVRSASTPTLRWGWDIRSVTCYHSHSFLCLKGICVITGTLNPPTHFPQAPFLVQTISGLFLSALVWGSIFGVLSCSNFMRVSCHIVGGPVFWVKVSLVLHAAINTQPEKDEKVVFYYHF